MFYRVSDKKTYLNVSDPTFDLSMRAEGTEPDRLLPFKFLYFKIELLIIQCMIFIVSQVQIKTFITYRNFKECRSFRNPGTGPLRLLYDKSLRQKTTIFIHTSFSNVKRTAACIVKGSN